MRKLPTLRTLTLSLLLGALAPGAAACSRLTGSGDDSKPGASPTPTSAPAGPTAAPAPTTVAPGTYAVNKALETSPGAVVTNVTVDATSTKLDFKFTNDRKQASALSVAKPGDREALFIEQPDGKKVPLVSSTGVALVPAKTTVPPGGTLELSAVFGPLDPGVRKFNVYEGEDAKKLMPGETTYWVVHDIELK